MLENLRRKVSQLSIGAKFIVRILYPIMIYLIFYIILHANVGVELQTVQLIFILLWLVIEWQIFFKKPNNSQ
ncbi:hypothetical protein [Brumimicrobium aurantiacum]|uniref:Uncharacterized protein n=1 Tax=Brumimicrobium aurantiacum TaxID=1737063 RepID=A0A3E1EW70_9FLAO|nr:hypothetical protein [Brumimicrobium aurantiacum]RFC53806.1 hypothetical protein DXU93_11810 [Brumimicrobium aurantiacum]